MTGAELIIAERQRQIDAEGWTPEHDAEHAGGQLASAAVSYAIAALVPGGGDGWWPWSTDERKPAPDPVRNLVKAGALIAAEIDRLLRYRTIAEHAAGIDSAEDSTIVSALAGKTVVGRMTVSANELRRHLGIDTTNPVGGTALQLVKDIAS